ncbi:hypothetical protein MSG28_004497 [Choristoneura fumiferana]|uniref:Uncharacterized protein n=1 Tax=Choristoneura fumiferana TaxID=7141 RepID=A0ACC0K6F9_CHOFU|nr:hypothetical protein MSG28_004497 [Choristoneura fumiferana]
MASNKDDAQQLGAGMLAMAVILLLVLALLLAFTITLLVGLHKRGHVKAYLIYSAIFLVLTVIMFFASFSQTVTASNVISNLLGIALHAYFFLVIRSQYHKMDDANKGAIYNTA